MPGLEIMHVVCMKYLSWCMQDVLARFKAKHGTNWDLLPEKAIFQMNDTHPTIAVAELIRLLVDDEKVAWDKAKDIARKALAFTNHTVMPEALERWPFEVMAELLPRHAQIIERLDLEWYIISLFILWFTCSEVAH